MSHAAVRLFRYRSQMTSRCEKHKKTAHEVECVTDVLMVKKQKVVNL